MKLSTAVVALVSLASTASAIRPTRATPSLMKAARRLDENGDDDEEDEEYAFLANYQLKMLSCKSGETYVNPENGEYEYSTVVFRLCPANAECEGDSGCSSGYGDFVVGINSFVESYLEDKAEDMNQDDNWNAEEFAECREYEVDDDADDEDEDGNNGQQYAYYVGPACMEDEVGVKLDFFTDEGCTTQSEDVTFSDISNGMSLPYSSGGLVSTNCESCAGYNDDNEWELGEMCMRLYEDSGKCETNMEYHHQDYGMQEGSCEFIEALMPKEASIGAGKVVGWLFFAAVVVAAGFAGFTMLKKKQDDREASLMSS